MNYGRWGRHQLRKLSKLVKKCWFNNVTLYEDKGRRRHFQVAWLVTLTSLEPKQLQIKAKMPTCSKNAQAKPTEDGLEGEKIINQ